jgi:hypothetical protein
MTMNVQNELLLDVEKEIGNLESIRALVQRIPAELVHVYQTCACGITRTILLSLPNNKDSKAETVSSLKDYGWKVLEEEVDKSSGDFTVELSHPECSGYLKLYFHPDITGATCKRQVIGYSNKPIYAITCMEAESLISA